ncbi:MAG: hypothetical protein D6784_10045, partial [Chloroflexi bacterium]
MKLFDSIQNKLLVAILVVVLLPLIGTGLYGNWITSRVLQDSALSTAHNETFQQAARVSAFLSNAAGDVLFLSHLAALQSLIAARQAENAADIAYWRQQVEQDFIAFSRYRRIYYQVRYIT